MLRGLLELEVRISSEELKLLLIVCRRFRNDFYPFIYPELKVFDPTGFRMVMSVFNVGEREGDTQCFTPAGGTAEHENNNTTVCVADYSPQEFSPYITNKNVSSRNFFFKFAVISPLVTYFAIKFLPSKILVKSSIFFLHISRYFC